jgi:hypothetical protein
VVGEGEGVDMLHPATKKSDMLRKVKERMIFIRCI